MLPPMITRAPTDPNYVLPRVIGFTVDDEQRLRAALAAWGDAMDLASRAANADYATDPAGVDVIFRRCFSEGTENRVQAVFQAIAGTEHQNIGNPLFATKFWVSNDFAPIGETQANSPCFLPLNLKTCLRDTYKISVLVSMSTRSLQSSSQSPLGQDETLEDEVLVVCPTAWTYSNIHKIGTDCGGPLAQVSINMVSLGALMLQDIVQWAWVRCNDPLTNPAIQDLYGAVNHDRKNLWNAVLLPQFVVKGQNYGSLALRNAWSYVWFALDNYYYEVCGSVRQAAAVLPGNVCLVNAIWLQTWGVNP